MSQDYGVYVGAFIECQLPKVTKIEQYKHCSTCGFDMLPLTQDFCGKDGTKLEVYSLKPKREYASYFDLMGDNEEFIDRVQCHSTYCLYVKGIVYFIPNQPNKGELDLSNGSLEFTPELASECLAKFESAYHEFIDHLKELNIEFKLKFGVFQWEEF